MANKIKGGMPVVESPCGGNFAGQPAGGRRPAILWGVKFQTVQPMESFPQLQSIVAERQVDRAYHFRGCLRASEHNCIFKFTLAGEGRFQVGRKKFTLPVGHGFLCTINDPLTSYYYPENGRAPWEFVYLSFVGLAARAMTSAFVRRYGPVFQLRTDAGFIPEILAWRRHDRDEISIAPAEGARIIAALFAALSQSKVRLDHSDAGFALVRETRRLVRKHLYQFYNVKLLAAHLGVSREHLGRVFKQQTAQTPYQYLQRQKMLEACRLLKETRLIQKEVAARMGYNVPAHFTRAFMRIMRLTPSRFREVGTIPAQ